MRDLLLITPREAVAVVIATVTLYVLMVVLIRLLGPRMLSSMSSFDLAAVIAFGAIFGRAALGEVPRMAGGVVALLTLVALQALTGALRAMPIGARAITAHAIVLMTDGDVLQDQLRRAHVSPAELQSKLRLAGIRHYDEVALALLEPTGAVSVLRRGDLIDPEMLTGVVGRGLVPPRLLAPDDT